ncbi:Hypothetical predicted protein [Octopus vulgaris]|uniref:DnaJ homolog subfamily B member 9 n=1 Tax=Octopus vulgaris TaxID=6645 RepID=A0AA36BPC0_OCTVU|nr:Hypothetical predicted protein [Octopus vulgaris]
MKNLYSIVGVDENATSEEIKKSYKKLAKKLHPDKNKSEDAEEKFKELSKAYEVLKSKESRQDYDFQRKYCQKGDESKRFQTKTTYDPRSRTRTFRFYDSPEQDKSYENKTNDSNFSDQYRRKERNGGAKQDKSYENKTNDSNFSDQYRRKERNGGAKQKKSYYFNKRSNSDSSSSSSSFRSSAERSTPRSTNHMNGHRENYEEPFEYYNRTSATQNERTRTREADRDSCSREDDSGSNHDTFSNSKPTYTNGYSTEFPKFFETFESIINKNMKYMHKHFFNADSAQNNLHSDYFPSSSSSFAEEPPPQRSELFSCAFCGLGFNLEEMRIHERRCMKTRSHRKSSDPFRKAFTAEPYTEDRKTNLFFKSSSNESEFSTCACPKNASMKKIHLPSCSEYKYSSSPFSLRQNDGSIFPSKSEWTPPVYTTSSSFETDFIPEPIVPSLLIQRINNILTRNSDLYNRKLDETNFLKLRSRCTSCQFVYSNGEEFICTCYISSRLM